MENSKNHKNAEIILQQDIPDNVLLFLKDLESKYNLPQINYNIQFHIYCNFVAVYMEINAIKKDSEIIIEQVKTILFLKSIILGKKGIKISSINNLKQNVFLTDLEQIKLIASQIEINFHYYYGRIFEEPYDDINIVLPKRINDFDYELSNELLDKGFDAESRALMYRNFIPYEIEELKSILNCVNEINLIKKKKKKELRKIRIRETVEFLKANRIFRSDLKSIGTNEACFLFDFIDFIENTNLSELYNSQEKYQQIKRILKD